MNRIILVSLVLCMGGINGYADNVNDSNYQVCFTPRGRCTDLIVNTVNRARKTVLVQAYVFTSHPIAEAFVDAKRRGVDVKVILDKSQFTNHYSSSQFLRQERIPLWNDYTVNIAHNKVIIIDGAVVITGSFNFTKTAQEENAENVLVINSRSLAKKYEQNWYERERESRRMD